MAADVTSCQIMAKLLICLHFATFFVLRVNKNIICPTDWQLKTEWNCRLKIQNRFRHSKVMAKITALPACRPQFKGIVTRCGSAGKKNQLRSGCFRYLSAVKTCFEGQSGNLID